ncbi:MAG: hypothetical protein P0119_06310 [Nitrospira sp.]|nr:hypothetical protein [Nitrospira sp.]
MGPVKEINVELDQNTLGIVLRTFTYMRDHFDDPNAWDPAAQMISLDDINQILQKMTPYQNSGESPVVIPMNFHSWVNYTGLLHAVSNKIPQRDKRDYEILDDLLVKCGEMDNAGLVPTGPQVSKKTGA